VPTRMMALIKDVEIELKNLAAKRGGNVIAVVEGTEQSGFGRAQAYRCDVDQQNAIRAKLAEAARTPVICTSQTECEVKWAKAIRWLQDNSRWKFRNVTENLVTTEGPMDSSNAAFEVTRVPHGDGKTYDIVLRAWCGASQCRPSILELGADFARVVGEAGGQAEKR
jgi:hypothetical protein